MEENQAPAEGHSTNALSTGELMDLHYKHAPDCPTAQAVAFGNSVMRRLAAQPQPKGTAPERLLGQVREVCAATLRAGPGVAVSLPAELAEEGRKFMRGEPSLIEQLPFADVQKLGDVLNETPATVPSPAPAQHFDDRPAVWVLKNPTWNSGAAHYGAECPPGWAGMANAEPFYRRPAPAVGADARAAALEEAALQCEAVKAEFERMAQGDNTGMYDHQAQGAKTCAEAIRSFAAIGGK